jgi:radical SAM superfamily enzyme YgiQ (UPF0313 family)
MRPRIFLADLRYDYSGVLANDTFPLGVAYMKAVMDRDLPEVQSRLFAYPGKLYDALREDPPDVLMVSNYVWNEALSCQFARLAKRINPRILTVMGGPNIQIEPHRQIDWFQRHPELDVYALGEGDFLAAEIVKRLLDAGMSIEKLGDKGLPSSVYRAADGAILRDETWDRHKEIGEIPSPFLTGILDEFFDGRLTPMMETNRGCPFTCTFCSQGTGWYTKVHNFPVDRIRDEIFYIARKIVECSPEITALRLADSNYGMFERDIQISSFLGETQKLYRWPTFIDATTGKNRPDRIIKSMEQVSGAMMLYQSVQSLDDLVLRNVKRQTIKLEAYEALQVYMRGRGMRSNSDLILGLPGVEEIACETETLPFADYLKARTLALACVAFWGHNRFDDVILFAQTLGMNRSEWLDLTLAAMEKSEGPIRRFVDDFLADTASELFPTRDACVDYYGNDENFERLKRGECGQNLLFGCRAVATFHLWPQICQLAMQESKERIRSLPEGATIPDFDEFWANLTEFVFLQNVHGFTTEQMLKSAETEMIYDIPAWLAAGKPKDLSPFKLSRPAIMRFQLSPESRRELESALHVFTESVRGLSKMLSRIRLACLVREAAFVSVSVG